jgi:alpha-D-xyloside xylohydrolase
MSTILGEAQGYYARRLIRATARPDGVRADVELIGFANMGDARRPVIVSDEPLAQQMANTHVPNRPPEETVAAAEHGRQLATLDVQALSSRVVRVRLGAPDELTRPRDFGMLIPEALVAASSPTFPRAEEHERDAMLRETAEGVAATVAGLTIRLRADPFAISVACAAVPAATVATALDDRNVHGLLCTPPPGVMAASGAREAFWSWALTPDEHLYGLGERFTGIDHRGDDITLWATDAWGVTTDASYKCIPFVHSSRGYGLFFHTPTPVTLRLGATSQRAALVRVGEPALDLFIIFGANPQAILGEYTRLTGRATMPPRWAFGVWLSRCRYQTRAEVEVVAARARAEDVPCDVLHIDPAWLERPGLSCDFVANEEAFPDLAGMVRALGERDFKISLWELPYVTSASRRYREAMESGYFLRDERGEPIGADFGAPPADGHIRAVLDFTNPAARAWWQDLHRPWLRAGVAVFKTDFGEGVPAAARAHNGMTGRELHNLFSLLYNGAVHEVIAQETGRPGMIWGRSGWAGIQRYPAQWGGDPKTDVWSMAASLRGGLSLALSAPGIWAHDIGGFYGPPPSPELYIRWAEFGLLSPLARAHGTTPREPWEFGAEALAIFRRYARLRTRLNPYLYTMAWETHEQGLPMLRPLVLEFPDDPIAPFIADSYLLGADLLVAPVFSESREPVMRRLYLPAGEWVDFWTDECVAGGRFITRIAPLDTTPVYVRAGAILPLGPERAFIGDAAPESLTLEVYPGAEGTARVVWDASGSATQLRLEHTRRGWQLDIAGDHVAAWRVRWHTGTGIKEAELGYVAAGTAVLLAEQVE